MINILQDGFSNFQNYFWMIFCICLAVIWGQVVMRKILSNVFANQFTTDEYFTLSLSGWVFPIIIWAGIYFLSNLFLGKTIGIIISIVLFLLSLFWIRIKKPSFIIVTIILFFFLSLIVRLAFLQQAIFPAYFDSAQHYQNIQSIINVYENKSPSLFQFNYYHLVYHFISAALIHLFQFNEINFMLVFGQIILTVLPISFFFLIKQITQSNTVAFFTCLMAAFGFHMPAHLINWGKYPALLSLVGIQFIFCLAYIFTKNKIHKRKLYWLIGLSVLITTLIHTRTLIAFVLLIPALFISYSINKLSIRFQYISFILLFTGLGIETFYITQHSALSPLITGYTQRDLWVLILILFLIPFSIKSFPNLVFFLLATLCLSIFFLFLPISIFNYGTQTLLDRPFVQMLAYIPLSIIAGLGFAGLVSNFQKKLYAKLLITFSLFAFVLLNAHFNYKFYPSDCCQLVSQDDVSAITWIDNSLSLDAKILIPSSRLYVTSYEPTQTQAGTDGGIWIQPLISRTTTLAPAQLNFELDNTHTQLCSQNIQYIYIGSMPQSFDQIKIASHPDWYSPIFLLPHVQVYEIIGCE
jgi:hypothetical protein